jgi:hypothetical protein
MDDVGRLSAEKSYMPPRSASAPLATTYRSSQRSKMARSAFPSTYGLCSWRILVLLPPHADFCSVGQRTTRLREKFEDDADGLSALDHRLRWDNGSVCHSRGT